MLKSVEFFIACRYIKARKKGFFAFLTTLIAIGGTTLGVCALVITLSVLSGFQQDIRAKILGVQPHIYINKINGTPFDEYNEVIEEISKSSFITASSPYIYGQGIIKKYKSTASGTGAVVKGIDYKKENAMLNLSDKLSEFSLMEDNNISSDGIILGSELAKLIGVQTGDDIVIIFPSQISSVPKMKKLKVEAVFHSGMYEYDTTLVYVDLKTADDMYGFSGGVSGIAVMTENFEKVQGFAKQLQQELDYPYRVRSWIDMNKNLFSALKLEKIMMFIILALIIIVASFNIISNILLLSVEKTKEIGILAACGFSRLSISKIFFYEGIIVGTIGTILGLTLGITISYVLKNFEIFDLPQGVYYIDKLPVVLLPQDIISVCVCAFVITVISGLYPAYQVSKLKPVEALRY